MRAPMRPPVLKMLDPRELARCEGAWSGEVPVRNFERASAVLDNDPGVVTLNLQFGLDDQGRCRVRGAAEVTAHVRCHRCLRRVERALDVAIDLAVVQSDQEAHELTPELDVMVLAERETSVAALVEDDLILAVPSRVCDREDACEYAPALRYGEEDDEPAERPNPFAALAALKGGTKS